MINIYELQQKIRSKEKKQQRIFKKILLLCVKRIKTVAQNEQTECIFSIPNVVFGLPLFNKQICLDFLIKKLTKKGFQIYPMPPNHLLISWKIIPKNHYPVQVEIERNANKPKPKPSKQAANYRDINKVYINQDDLYQNKTLVNYDQYIQNILGK